MKRTNALNPNAQPWEPMLGKVREEERTIFITFSRGHPLSCDDVGDFFERRYGDCIEKIHIHHRDPMRPPLFGTVVFSKCSVPAMIFGGKEEQHFEIHKSSFWCKRYKKSEA